MVRVHCVKMVLFLMIIVLGLLFYGTFEYRIKLCNSDNVICLLFLTIQHEHVEIEILMFI